jgi:1-deoxy-D-xylulose-5-phosphate synthase
VGGDGATHQGSYDYSFLRCIPNLTVMAPADENECRQMLYTATCIQSPAAVRYPRGQGPGVAIESEMAALPIGKAEMRREGHGGLLILAFGAMVRSAEFIGERLDATVVNMRFIKPLDEELVLRLAARHQGLVTFEENAVAGGAGSAVVELLANCAQSLPTLTLGIPDRFVEHGSRDECLAMAELDQASLHSAVERWWRPLAGRRASSGT